MKITMTEQLIQLFFSCGLGFVLSMYYDVFRVARMVMKSRMLTVFVQDVIFFLSAAVVTFLFSLAFMEGRLRFYLFIGEIIGFFAYRLTIGRIVIRFSGAVITVVTGLWLLVWKIIFAPFHLIGHLFSPLLQRIGEFFSKKGANLLIIFKKGLKHTLPILYNRKG